MNTANMILKTQFFHKMKIDLEVHMRPLLCYVEVAYFFLDYSYF